MTKIYKTETYQPLNKREDECSATGWFMDEAAEQILNLDKEKQEYLNRYFAGAPHWLLKKFQVVEIPAGTIFISEGESADRVYVLLQGQVSAVDYRVQEAVYGFFQFYPIEIFGVMEILGGMERYKTTLAALEKSVFLKIGRDQYERWLKSDSNAFQMETMEIVNYLLEQARKERLYVLLPGNQRIYQVLLKLYRSYEVNGKYSAHISRKDFAEMTGLSERTITRTIKSLESGGYIAKEGWNITLSQEQYQRLQKLADSRMNEIIS